MKKVYIKEQDGYVIDLVEIKEYIEGRDDYREVEVNGFNGDILSGYYKYSKGAFVVDEDKKSAFLAALENEKVDRQTVSELQEQIQQMSEVIDMLLIDSLGGVK